MPTLVQHTGIATHHIVERCILLVVRVPGHSRLVGIAWSVRAVLAVMVGVASMCIAVVYVLS